MGNMQCRRPSDVTLYCRALSMNLPVQYIMVWHSVNCLMNKVTNYKELQTVMEKTPKKDILVVQGDWNAKIREEECKDWKGTSGHHCNTKSSDRGKRLLEFATYDDLVVVNTFGPHKTPRKIT